MFQKKKQIKKVTEEEGERRQIENPDCDSKRGKEGKKEGEEKEEVGVEEEAGPGMWEKRGKDYRW